MTFDTVLYIIAIVFVIIFSYLAIKTRSVLISLIYLIGMYVAGAWALIQAGAWFLSLIYLFVNAGGVLVLIIFASMLTRPARDIPTNKKISFYGIIVSTLIVALIGVYIYSSNANYAVSYTSNYYSISSFIFSYYFVGIIIIAIAALSIYFGAIYLASEEK